MAKGANTKIARVKAFQSIITAWASLIKPKAKSMLEKGIEFDVDSFLIGIDGHAPYCVSNKKRDTVGKLRKVMVRIIGIWGGLTSVYIGTKNETYWKIQV